MTEQKQQKKAVNELIINDLVTPEVITTKAMAGYGIAGIIITISLGTISILNLNAYFPGFLVITCQLLAFLWLGVYYLSLLKKKTLFPNKFGKNNVLIFTILTSLFIGFILAIVYFIKDGNMVRLAFASSCSFLLPFVISQVWKAYTEVPKKEYNIWYNSDGVIDNRTTIFLNSVQIRLSIAMKYFDIENDVFELTVPGHTQFGKFFNQFIIEKNKNNASAIESVDMEKKPFGWQFHTSRLWGLYHQIIDPERSLIENSVKSNSTITAKRIREVAIPAKENAEAAEWKAVPVMNKHKSVNKHEAKK